MITIRLRRDDAVDWQSLNPTLEDGEPGWDRTNRQLRVGDGTTTWDDLPVVGGFPVTIGVACSSESTELVATTAAATFRLPHALTSVTVRASLTAASTSGAVTVDVNEGGTSILSTKLTIDQGEKTSTTAATAVVVSDPALADDAEITVDIDAAGADATGLKVWLIGMRPTP